MGDNSTLKDLEARMREAAANLEFEEAARLRDEVKRLKLLDLELAADALARDRQTGHRAAVKGLRAGVRAEKAAAFRKKGRAGAVALTLSCHPGLAQPRPGPTSAGFNRRKRRRRGSEDTFSRRRFGSRSKA